MPMRRYVFPNPHFDKFGGVAGCVIYLLYLMEDQATNSYGNSGRYRHSLANHVVDSILFVYDGCFIGEILVDDVVEPNAHDKEQWELTARVYLAKEQPRLFRDLEVRASDVGLTGIRFGREVSPEVYADIIKRTGGFIN